MNEPLRQAEQALNFLHTGDVAQALSVVDAALLDNQDDYGLLFVRGEALRISGRLAEAEEAFARSAQAGSAEAYFRLGVTQAALGKWVEAEHSFAVAVQIHPDNVAGWQHLSTCRSRLGKTANSLAALEKAAELEPGNTGTLQTLLHAYVDAQRFAQAEVLARQIAVDRLDDAWWSGALLGWLFRATERHSEAVAAYRRAVVLQPQLAEYYASLGSAMRQAEMPDDARATFLRAMQIEPGIVEANIGLAGVEFDRGDYGEALSQLARFEATAPDFKTAKRSVVIPVLDYSPGSPYNIRTLLDDLADFDGEVICIFNGDQVYNDLRDHPRIDKYSYNKYNVGVSRAWNMGINQAEGDTIHILNADLKISVAMLSRLEAWLHQLPDALCVGVSAHWYDFATLKETDALMTGRFSTAVETDMVSGQLFSLHSARLHDAGISFDPRLSPYFGEEVDLALKTKRSGYKMYAVPETDFEHSWGISLRDQPIRFFGRPVHRLRCFVYNQSLLGQKIRDRGLDGQPVKPPK